MKKVILISGPSGVGKGELIKRLKIEFSSLLYFAKSVTTRPIRSHEKEGVDYYFWNQEKFSQAYRQDLFLETAQIFDHYYGTLASETTDTAPGVAAVVIEADIQGIQSLQAKIKNTLSIFLLPPDLETLKNRLKKRQTESPADQAKRFLKTKSEIFAISRYNYLIVNDKLDHSFDELKRMLIKECEEL